MADNTLPALLRRDRPQIPVVGPLLLYLLPLPLLPAVFVALLRGNVVHLVSCLAAICLLWGGGWLIRRGMARDLEMQRLGWSRQPPRPLKTLGALAAGVATGLCSLLVIGRTPAAAGTVALITGAAVLLSYGIDGCFLRRFQRAPPTSRDREVAESLDEAQLKIASIDRANHDIHNAELNRRIRRIVAQAMDILTAIADDPATLRRARKFLKVYLDGAQRVIEGYARVHQGQRNAALDDNFRKVLVTIEDTFVEQRLKLQEKDALDLDVQIEVLTTQLKNEGVI